MRKFFPYLPKSALARWFDKRLPLPHFLYNRFIVFPVLRNLNYFDTFGGILTIIAFDRYCISYALCIRCLFSF